MPATVTLQVVSGTLHGAEFVYETPALCSVGRGQDCTLRLPNDVTHRTVSRHHCLLEIAPPEAWVCDAGSLNGTYVNGERIGHRGPDDEPEPAGIPSVPNVALHDGDELRVGDVIFRVRVRAGARAPGGALLQEVG
jgi:pSer/pThr/pTyr-binding forkhead associated (FHA) protein